MQKFARAQVGKSFNKGGMYRASLPLLWRGSDGEQRNGTWFCSELTAAILQAGGLISQYNPGSISPNFLLDLCVAQEGLRASLTANRYKLCANQQTLVASMNRGLKR